MDLFSLTANPQVFKEINEGTIKIIENEVGHTFNVVVGLDARGFIQGPIIA